MNTSFNAHPQTCIRRQECKRREWENSCAFHDSLHFQCCVNFNSIIFHMFFFRFRSLSKRLTLCIQFLPVDKCALFRFIDVDSGQMIFDCGRREMSEWNMSTEAINFVVFFLTFFSDDKRIAIERIQLIRLNYCGRKWNRFNRFFSHQKSTTTISLCWIWLFSVVLLFSFCIDRHKLIASRWLINAARQSIDTAAFVGFCQELRSIFIFSAEKYWQNAWLHFEWLSLVFCGARLLLCVSHFEQFFSLDFLVVDRFSFRLPFWGGNTFSSDEIIALFIVFKSISIRANAFACLFTYRQRHQLSSTVRNVMIGLAQNPHHNIKWNSFVACRHRRL